MVVLQPALDHVLQVVQRSDGHVSGHIGEDHQGELPGDQTGKVHQWETVGWDACEDDHLGSVDLDVVGGFG